MSRPGRWVTTAVMLAALAGVILWVFAPRPVRVELAAATRGPLAQTVDEEGKTRVRDRYVVSSPIAGRLARITIDPGDTVTRGMVIASLTPAPPQLLDVRTRAELEARIGSAAANVERARGTLARAAATAKQAANDLARTESLQRQGFVSAAQADRDRLALEVARRDVTIAEAQVHAAEFELTQARAALATASGSAGRTGERFEVRSPVAGQVLRVVQESEAVVASGAALVEIGDPRELEIVVDVLSTDAVAIAPGSLATIERWGGGDEVSARVRSVEPHAFTKVSALGVEEQRVSVVLDVVRAPEAWTRVGDGYRVLARIRTGQVDSAVIVPVGSLVRSREGWQVFVADGRVARLRDVRLALRNATHAAIASGLEAGEQVVMYPPAALTDGRRIDAR